MKLARLLPLLSTTCFLLLALWNPPWIDESIEALLLDYRFKLRNAISAPAVPDNILIVTIDEPSLIRFGRWPWNRALQAEMINRVAAGKPRAIGVDVFYSEAETPETDQALADALSNSAVDIVTALAFDVTQDQTEPDSETDILFEYALMQIENRSACKPICAQRVLLPPPPLNDVAHFGHVYSLPDRDGKLRKEALFLRYGEDDLPSLALLTTALAQEIPFSEITILGGQGIDLAGRLISSDLNGRVPINYYGKEGSFQSVSAADLLDQRTDAEIFHGKIVFIGTSAIATYDQKSTPFSANMPGVEKNATVAANILENNFLRKGPLSTDLLMVLVSGLVLLWISHCCSALQSVFGFVVLGATILVFNQMFFTSQGLVLNLVYPLGNSVSGSFFVIGYKYLVEERSARQLKSIFSSYVTPRVMEEVLQNPEVAKLGGQRREVSILFSDIRGFSSFSEKNAPEYIVEMLNEYLEAMTDIVFHWEGTLDKFVGDAVIAFWSAPLPQPDHAERAVRCSLHMLQRLGELQKKWRLEGKEPLDIGIGLNSGEVVVGNIGAENKKMDYTVIGNHVNLCARIESLTRKYDEKLLISEHLLTQIQNLINNNAFGHMAVTEIEKVTVKGISKAVSVYGIVPRDHGEGFMLK